MSRVHSTDRYTLIEQSVNHRNTLTEQSLHCCFVAELRPPASKTDFQRTRNIIPNWSGLIIDIATKFAATVACKLILADIGTLMVGHWYFLSNSILIPQVLRHLVLMAQPPKSILQIENIQE